MWMFLLAGVILMSFTIVMFLHYLDNEFGFTKFILLVGLPGAIGGMCLLSFWLLLIAKVFIKMVH